MSVTAEIAEAIEQLQETFPDSDVTWVDDGAGGAWVTVSDLPMGTVFEPTRSWMTFNITYPYPEADIYPLFVTPELHRRDGMPLGEGIQSSIGHGPGGVSIGTQLSRRSNRLNPAVDTAVTKVLKVLKWLAEQK